MFKECFILRNDILEKRDLILTWVSEELPKSEMARRLACKQETLNSCLKKLGIEYAGQQNKKGQQKGPNKYLDSSHYTGKNARPIKSAVLREKLIRDGIKKDCCERCGAKYWNGKKLPLELHHKDGNHYNNELDNLEILCPNCHAVEGDNAGAAIGNYT